MIFVLLDAEGRELFSTAPVAVDKYAMSDYIASVTRYVQLAFRLAGLEVEQIDFLDDRAQEVVVTVEHPQDPERRPMLFCLFTEQMRKTPVDRAVDVIKQKVEGIDDPRGD